MGDVMSVEDRRYVTYLMIAKELIKIQPIDAVKINKIASKYDLSYGDINRIWKQLVDGKCTPKKMTFLDRCDFMMSGDIIFQCPLYKVEYSSAWLDQNKTPKFGEGFHVSFLVHFLTERDVDFFAELADIKIGGTNFGKGIFRSAPPIFSKEGNKYLPMGFHLDASLFWNCPQVLDEYFVEAKFVSQYSNTYRPVTKKFVTSIADASGKTFYYEDSVNSFKEFGIINDNIVMNVE